MQRIIRILSPSARRSSSASSVSNEERDRESYKSCDSLEMHTETRDFEFNKKISHSHRHDQIDQVDKSSLKDKVEYKNGGQCGSLVMNTELFTRYQEAVFQRYWTGAKENRDMKVHWTEVKDKRKIPAPVVLEDKIQVTMSIQGKMTKLGMLHMFRTTGRMMFQGAKAQWWWKNEFEELTKMVDKQCQCQLIDNECSFEEEYQQEKTTNEGQGNEEEEDSDVTKVKQRLYEMHETEQETKKDENGGNQEKTKNTKTVKTSESSCQTDENMSAEYLTQILESIQKLEDKIVETTQIQSIIRTDLEDLVSKNTATCESTLEKLGKLESRVKSLENQPKPQRSPKPKPKPKKDDRLQTPNRFAALTPLDSEEEKETPKPRQNDVTKPEAKSVQPKTENMMTEMKPVDLLIVTSSIGKNIRGSELYKNRTVIVKELRNGKNIRDAKEFISESCEWNPTVIQFMVGGNDLTSNKTPNEVMEEMEELLHVTKEKFPNAHIVCSEVLPRMRPNDFNRKMESFNMKLADCALDNTYFMPQENLRDLRNMYDGIHVKDSQLGKMAVNIKKVVNQLLGLKEYDSANRNVDHDRYDRRGNHNQRNQQSHVNRTGQDGDFHGQTSRNFNRAQQHRDYGQGNGFQDRKSQNFNRAAQEHREYGQDCDFPNQNNTKYKPAQDHRVHDFDDRNHNDYKPAQEHQGYQRDNWDRSPVRDALSMLEDYIWQSRHNH